MGSFVNPMTMKICLALLLGDKDKQNARVSVDIWLEELMMLNRADSLVLRFS